ncbi:alpha/beta fold hydrolase [Rathayibacter toxicus]|uniref:Alpha/beta hydrolase n=1 Tax=Rathayibacter toxicus TaxID=145458 RepID=A0A0C5BC91_9MICO|nr:alpha/beta hydrolase [Rathayibacter toxicus]AJM76796.1 bromoperoxidase [Rathayibacter toxicus]ALS57444.1 bromoperoxidase [Rathayibacter toxicus]KKM44471.1 bromoperoxidase [Rathayibacter toxicus]PPG20892.1 alpha/beta hydrolase [Rathayibacter toxicus]PPG45996.1 alpha/beta hydrolase [Rathayibacter toxicus]
MTDITARHGLIKDFHLHVDDTGGSGRPVVFLHGWPLSGELWKEQVPAFTEVGYRVITYDRRGFGRSDKPLTGYSYDTLTDDLHALLTGLDLRNVTLVGFSMGGGEVARYFSKYGTERLHSVVFASAVPPYLLRTSDNPDGPWEQSQATEMIARLTANDDAFYRQFEIDFFSAEGTLAGTPTKRQEVLALTKHAAKHAALACITTFVNTDFREDLAKITVPTLVIHGDSDGPVPLEGSGARTHAAIPGSTLYVISGGPHGVNVSHADEWNRAVLEFLAVAPR